MENHSTGSKLSSSHAISLILTFCALSAIFIYLIYSENIVFGSIAGGQVYSYFNLLMFIPKWIPITVIFLAGVIIYLGSKLLEKHEKLTLLGCFVLAIVIQILIQKVSPYSMDQMIVSDNSNSFYSAALTYSPIQILSQFQTLVHSLPYHAATNMPGKILFYQFLTLLTTSPQVMGYLIISFSTLGGVLLYAICKRLFQDNRLALYAFMLYALIPCKQVFFPILNTVSPVFILLCLYLFLIYLDSKKKVFLILLGVCLYFLVLFEPSPLVTGLLFLGILFHAFVEKKVSIKDLIFIPLISILSFLAVYLLFDLFFSFNLWPAFQYMMQDAITFNQSVGRSYTIWLTENVKDFFFSAGLPTMMIVIYFVINIFSQWKTTLKNALHQPLENVYILSLLLTFCIVLFLGINRGETTRLWIYLAVFFQVPAAYFMAKMVKNNTLFFILAVTLIAQSLITIQRVQFIHP